MEETQATTVLEPDAQPFVSAVVAGELKKLAVHSSHYLAGLLGSLGLGFLSFPIFTRAFSVAEYGLIDLVQKLVLLLVAGGKMGLQNAALRFYDVRRFAALPGEERKYYSTMFFGVLASGGAVAGVFWIAARWLGAGASLGSVTGVLYVVALLVVLRSLGSILYAFLRIEERTKMFNAVAVAGKAAILAVVCALLPWMGRMAGTYFVGAGLVEVALAAVLIVPLARRKLLAPSSFDFSLWKAGVAFGLPLVVYEWAFTLLGSADRFLVRHYLGAQALGLYSVAYGLAQSVNDLLVTPLGLALMPIYIRLWSTEGSEKTAEFLSVTFDAFLLVAAGILAVAAACAQDAVLVLASAKYAGAGQLIPLLLAGLLIYTMHIFLAAGLLIHKRSLQMAGILAAAAGFNIAANCLLLPRMGLVGGSLAVLLSYGACILGLWRASNRLLALRVRARHLCGYAAAGVLAWLAAASLALAPGAAGLAVRAALASAVYASAVLLVDGHVRTGAGRLLAWAVAMRRARRAL